MSCVGSILIACESSGNVRRAFAARGWDAWSCDLLPADDGSPNHIQGDALAAARSRPWDVMVGHPPCTYLTGSAAWAFTDGPYHQQVKPGTLVGQARREARTKAIVFAQALWDMPIRRIALENPVGHLSSVFGKPTQIIQPNWFGHDASKKTCLWLKNLPPLKPTKLVPGRKVEHNGQIVERWANQTDSGQNRLSPSEDRWQKRSETYPGIAEAMAKLWTYAHLYGYTDPHGWHEGSPID